ncbi:hypothetical protein MMC22_002167 [Lobaria immixta]|nr:hypothetical protein [Lobaria immixta]
MSLPIEDISTIGYPTIALDECAYISNGSPHSLKFPEQAATELEWFLDPIIPIDSMVRAAILRLRAGLEIQDWKPDLVIKAFHDLDTVFFQWKVAWPCYYPMANGIVVDRIPSCAWSTPPRLWVDAVSGPPAGSDPT